MSIFEVNQKSDETRNIFITNEGLIILETNSKYYTECVEFLIAIAEPKHRTQNFHEYLLTEYSLYAAASMNIKTEDILVILRRISKNGLPKEVEKMIVDKTETHGKVKLILKNQRYFIEAKNWKAKSDLLKTDVIYKSHMSIKEKNKNNDKQNQENQGKMGSNKLNLNLDVENKINSTQSIFTTINMIANKNLIDEKDNQEENTFEIDPNLIEDVKKRCIQIGYPLLEEYDFHNDIYNPDLEIQTKLKSSIRPYQEKALSIMFNNKRARSGVIVLPCGAGKTLVGILTTCTIKKNTVVLCNSAVSVEQWYREYLNWTNIEDCYICRFTSKKRDSLWNLKEKAGILVTTYTMISFQGKRNPEVQTMIDQIKSIEWGLLIMDEVQVVPADMFRKTLTITKSHCKLGLTATLVREDEKIADLNFLIGPKHYEANWSDLQKDGYLARVQCIEIWTEMNSHFYEYYIKATVRKKMMLYFSNPNKLIICKSLIKHHKNDKIIIFCDDLFTLHKYAIELKVPFITGGVSHQEREKYIGEFRNTNKFNCLIMSKVGDTSIDIPNANVIIQISSHFGSRRQEAQRLGRILRPKPDSISEFNAYFYSIVSKNTEEMYFSNKRHKFLIDQGYCFKVVTSLADLNIKQIVSKDDDTLFLQMLDEIQYKNENEIEDESLSDNEYVDDNRSDLDYNENDLIEISEVDYNDEDNDYEMN